VVLELLGLEGDCRVDVHAQQENTFITACRHVPLIMPVQPRCPPDGEARLPPAGAAPAPPATPSCIHGTQQQRPSVSLHQPPHCTACPPVMTWLAMLLPRRGCGGPPGRWPALPSQQEAAHLTSDI